MAEKRRGIEIKRKRGNAIVSHGKPVTAKTAAQRRSALEN